MACDYCFYKNGEAHHRGVMSEQTASSIVDAAFAYAAGPVHFAFQGGEPTLAGLDFFRKFVALAEKANVRNLPLSWSIQTNGLEPTQEMCSFFAAKKFLVGVSLDGCESVHNKFRHTVFGENSFDRVLSGIGLYREAGADVNVLTVVTGELCRNFSAVWDFLAGTDLPCVQFITCLDGDAGCFHGCSPTVEEFGDFLVNSFRAWKKHIRAEDYISVRYFDNLIAACLGAPGELCSSAGRCTNQLVVEADGSVYPCDFYVEPKYCIGNIRSDGVEKLLASLAADKFISSRPESPGRCRSCRWFSLCRSGCRREFDTTGKTLYCNAYKRFFKECEKDVLEVSNLVRQGKIKTERV